MGDPPKIYSLECRKGITGIEEVWDPARKKYVTLTPEEWVRQQFIRMLKEQYQYPYSLMGVEKGLKYHALQKRTDLICFDRQGKPVLLAEFKNPEVALTEETYFQSALYMHSVGALWIVLHNFKETLIWRKDESGDFIAESSIPIFNAS